MKRLLIILICIWATNVVSAQNADQRIADLINAEDWFALDEEYPRIKDSVQTDFLRPMAEAMLYLHFNQPQDAITAIKQLLSNHQEQISSSTTLNFAILLLQTMGETGRYAEAADGFKSLAEQLPEVGSIAAMYKHYNVLRDFPPMAIDRPKRDVVVPFQLQEYKAKKREAWMREGKRKFKGYHITVPVTIHGIERQFVFDAGAGATFITEKTARELGLMILPDTIALNGTQKGMRAFIDSLSVGGIVCRNMVVYVGLPNALDSIADGFEAALGLDFIKAVGETQILFDQREILFPANPSTHNAAHNVCLAPDLVMLAQKDGKRLLLGFDSGCTTAELYDDYYQKFRAEVDAIAIKDTVTTGSYGNVANVEIKLLPNVTFNVGGSAVTLDEMELYPPTDNWLYTHDGRMGMALIRLFRKTTINLNDMYIKFE